MSTTDDGRTRRMSTWDLICEDFQTHGRSRVSPGMHALALHRLGHAAYQGRTLRHRLGRVLYRAGRIVVAGLYSVEIPVETRIGRRLHLPHAHGVVLNGSAVIGDDCLLRHNVTVGAASDARREAPVVGDRVKVGPGAVLMGGITIGDDVLIGPNSVVVADVPAGSRVVAPVAAVRPPRSDPEPRGGAATEDRE